jgi:hypothetical protein
MTKITKLTIWTIVLSFFILIGAGHGIAFIGLFEIAGLSHKFNIGTERFSFLPTSYIQSLPVAALFALIGHICLFIPIIARKTKTNLPIYFAGLMFLWISYCYMSLNFNNDNTSQISIVSGMAFIVISVILAINLSLKLRSVNEGTQVCHQ